MSPITISVAVFACVFGGALLGIFIHSLLPNEHLDSDSKEAVRLGMALVGTTVALVLGLLIASGKGFYDTQSSEVTQLAADVVLLDKVLTHFGPETKEIRALLRSSVARMADATWREKVRTRPIPPLPQQMKKPSLTKFRSSLPTTKINDSYSRRR
jgi:Kef-type K+ transport system membrane component KefB